MLPFRVVGDKEALGYIADGLSEALSARLFPLPDIHVASSTIVEKTKQDSFESAARELAVNLIVHGTVQGTIQAGRIAKLLVIVNLEDIAARRRLWSDEVAGVPQDLLSMEDQIYSKLVSALALRRGVLESRAEVAHPTCTEAVSIWQAYIKLAPDGPDGLASLGYCLTELRRYDEATQALESASLQPRDATTQPYLVAHFHDQRGVGLNRNANLAPQFARAPAS